MRRDITMLCAVVIGGLLLTFMMVEIGLRIIGYRGD